MDAKVTKYLQMQKFPTLAFSQWPEYQDCTVRLVKTN